MLFRETMMANIPNGFELSIDPIAVISSEQAGTLIGANQPHIVSGRSEGLIGSIIDQKYQVLGPLGEGGMGAVYKARHLMLDKVVALKTFRKTKLSADDLLRFQREAQVIARVNHKNIVQVFDFGLSCEGIPYYTMEYLLGRSLEDRIKCRGPMEVAAASELFVQICSGLRAAHSKGIIHKDLKPANLFIEMSLCLEGIVETAKIVDFGIASLDWRKHEGHDFTTSGIILGSPLYMSPEQSMGDTITESSDIYSLGCTLFHAIAGRPPFYGSNALETMMLHQTVRAPSLKEASGGRDYPPGLERIVATMLSKSPSERQSTIGIVAAQLSQLRLEPQHRNSNNSTTQSTLGIAQQCSLGRL